MQINDMEYDLKTVNLNCPICQSRIKMNVSVELVKSRKNGVVAFSTKHCGKTLIAHVDQNFKVRSVETAHFSEQQEKFQEEYETEKILQKIYPSIQDGTSREECVFYFCNNDCKEKAQSLPNIIEKQLLKVVHDTRGVNLKSLKEGLSAVEKAYNMDFSYKRLETILEKYVNQGLITREEFD